MGFSVHCRHWGCPRARLPDNWLKPLQGCLSRKPMQLPMATACSLVVTGLAVFTDLSHWLALAHVAAVQLVLLAAMLWLLLVTSSATDADGFLYRYTSCSKGSQETFQQRDLQAHLDRQVVWKPQYSNNDLAHLCFFSFSFFLILSYSFNLKGNAIWDTQALL